MMQTLILKELHSQLHSKLLLKLHSKRPEMFLHSLPCLHSNPRLYANTMWTHLVTIHVVRKLPQVVLVGCKLFAMNTNMSSVQDARPICLCSLLRSLLLCHIRLKCFRTPKGLAHRT